MGSQLQGGNVIPASPGVLAMAIRSEAFCIMRGMSAQWSDVLVHIATFPPRVLQTPGAG